MSPTLQAVCTFCGWKGEVTSSYVDAQEQANGHDMFGSCKPGNKTIVKDILGPT